jgi:hypothetical protein
MDFVKKWALTIFSIVLTSSSAGAEPGQHFNRAIFVLFENTSYRRTIAQPFFKELADRGANFTNFFAEARPSQPNYIALTSGDTHGVRTNSNINLNVRNIVDLLEAKGIEWRAYAEDFPGNCFQRASTNNYARKHNPFISYINIQNNPQRCAKIVNANQFATDVAGGTLPSYVFYIPDMNNDGHDTGVRFADRWYRAKFGPLVNSDEFMKGTVLISTFDEGSSRSNQIYTSIVGPNVVPATIVEIDQNHYSLLKLIEDNWNLGNLGLRDSTAAPVPNIWKQ